MAWRMSLTGEHLPTTQECEKSKNLPASVADSPLVSGNIKWLPGDRLVQDSRHHQDQDAYAPWMTPSFFSIRASGLHDPEKEQQQHQNRCTGSTAPSPSSPLIEGCFDSSPALVTSIYSHWLSSVQMTAVAALLGSPPHLLQSSCSWSDCCTGVNKVAIAARPWFPRQTFVPHVISDLPEDLSPTAVVRPLCSISAELDARASASFDELRIIGKEPSPLQKYAAAECSHCISDARSVAGAGVVGQCMDVSNGLVAQRIGVSGGDGEVVSEECRAASWRTLEAVSSSKPQCQVLLDAACSHTEQQQHCKGCLPMDLTTSTSSDRQKGLSVDEPQHTKAPVHCTKSLVVSTRHPSLKLAKRRLVTQAPLLFSSCAKHYQHGRTAPKRASATTRAGTTPRRLSVRAPCAITKPSQVCDKPLLRKRAKRTCFQPVEAPPGKVEPDGLSSSDLSLTAADLCSGALVLLQVEDGLLREAVVECVAPPSVYAVRFVSERNSKRQPSLVYARDDLLSSAIRDISPACGVGEGVRVCAYWSGLLDYLYPGTTASALARDRYDGKYLAVATPLDSSTTGLLCRSAAQQPDLGSGTHRLCCDERVGVAAPLISICFDDGDSGEFLPSCVRLLPADFPFLHPTEGARPRRQLSVNGLSMRESHSGTAKNDDSHLSFDSPLSSVVSHAESCCPYGPNCWGWTWAGSPVRRKKQRGKRTRRVHYTAIRRDHETLQIGDCAMFASMRSDEPYVGKIVDMWQEDNVCMVRAKWFYRPHEVSLGHEQTAADTVATQVGALYESEHTDANSVQTILCKCKVLPAADSSRAQDSRSTREVAECNFTFYVAGTYDAVAGKIVRPVRKHRLH